MQKTNAMRILDKNKVEYKVHTYIDSDAVSGVEVADYFGYDYDDIFKTLVTVSKTNNHYVFLIPVDKELDMKKAAKAVSEKSVEMLKGKDLLPLTGYVHGGCSPIGMKKPFPTIIDISAKEHIYFSGGKIGYQIETTLTELRKALNFKQVDIVK